MDRRRFLKGLGAAASTGLAGCVRYRNDNTVRRDDGGELEGIRIFQTEEMQEALPRQPTREPTAVFKQYLTRAITDLAERSDEFDPIPITVQQEPVSLDLDDIQSREIEFDQYIQDRPKEAAKYSNLLLDRRGGPFEPLGLALCRDCGTHACHLDNDTTDTAIISGGELTHDVTTFNESFATYDAARQQALNDNLVPLFGGIHEVGHTLCSIHRDGNAWLSSEAPSRYNPSDDGVYASPMMGPYIVRYGGGENTTGKSVASFDVRGSQKLYYGNLFATSFVDRLDRLLSIDGNFVEFQPTSRRGRVNATVLSTHTYDRLGFGLPEDATWNGGTEEQAFTYEVTLDDVNETLTINKLRDGDEIQVYGINGTGFDIDEELVQRFEYDGV